MQFLYVDESGNYSDATDHFVIGAISVNEVDLDRLRVRVRQVQERHLAAHLHGLELHAQHIRVGKGAWRGIPKEVRGALLSDLCRTLVRFRRDAKGPFALFAVSKAPASIPGADTLERCFEELFLRFHEQLVRTNPEGPGPRGIAIADKARYESTLQPITTRWREQGTRFKRLKRLIEVPLFCDSAASPLVQMADLVAHAVCVNYARQDATLFDELIPGFDAGDSVVHGLVHLTAERSRCPCIGCTTRRAARRL